jgi:hypothetical protein
MPPRCRDVGIALIGNSLITGNASALHVKLKLASPDNRDGRPQVALVSAGPEDVFFNGPLCQELNQVWRAECREHLGISIDGAPERLETLSVRFYEIGCVSPTQAFVVR